MANMSVLQGNLFCCWRYTLRTEMSYCEMASRYGTLRPVRSHAERADETRGSDKEMDNQFDGC
jgi:hypothetical protein